MSANPIELIGGLTDTNDVPKADIVSWAKARVPQVLANNAEIRTTNLALQQVVFVKSPGISWYLDAADSTTADDDITCVISLDNKRFKPLSSIPAPTLASLGGVFSLAPVANHFLTGIDTDGTPLHAQPSAANLSDGVTGTDEVVLSTSPHIVTPTGIVKADVGLSNVDNTSDSTKWAAVATLTNKVINAVSNTISNLATSMFAANVVDTDTTLAANSDTRLATQKAVKAYVDALLNANDAMQFRGVIDCSANPNYPAANAGYVYRVSVAGKIGGASGVNVEAGDQLLCITDGTSAGTQAAVGANWSITQSNIDGAVVGPASAASGRIATFNGTTGKLIQDGGQSLPSGTIVGTTDTQTLTNKTLTSPAVNTPTVTGGTHDAITSFGIRSTGAAFDLKMATAEVLTGNRTLTWVLGDAARTLTLGGNATLNGGTHSGTNTGDQTITLTGDVTGTGTGSFATTIGPNKVTLGMMAQIATATFLGRTSASAGNVEALTTAQATALINTMIGDSGSGGTKGLVPAPGAGDAAAGKYLKADGTYAVPPGTGGGGSYPDVDRQNALLVKIYQSKSFAEYRRFINEFATGFKGASDALNGILTGSSSNYTVNSSSGYVAPSLSPVSYTLIPQASGTAIGNMTSGGGLAASFDSNTSQAFASASYLNTAGALGNVGKDWGSGNSHIVGKIVAYGTTDFGFGNGTANINLLLEGSNNGSSWTTLFSTTFANANSAIVKTFTNSDGIIVTTAYRYHRVSVTDTGGTGFPKMAELQFYDYVAPVANNMTLVTAAQTSDSSVSNCRVLIELDNTASPTLNTDLTAEVSCDGGANWANASLSAVTSYSGTSAQRRVVESVDQSCGANTGTDFRARIKTLNNKSVPIYGVSVTVH